MNNTAQLAMNTYRWTTELRTAAATSRSLHTSTPTSLLLIAIGIPLYILASMYAYFSDQGSKISEILNCKLREPRSSHQFLSRQLQSRLSIILEEQQEDQEDLSLLELTAV